MVTLQTVAAGTGNEHAVTVNVLRRTGDIDVAVLM
jgi:hypothetical protein